METIDDDLSFLTRPGVSASLPEAMPELVVEPERPSLLVTEAQVLTWKASAQDLERELQSMQSSLRWSEVELVQFQKNDYQRELDALELAVSPLVGAERQLFLEAHRQERLNLLAALQAVDGDHAEYVRRAALLEPVQQELSQVRALILADELDSKEAGLRAARYARLYGPG